MRPTEPRYREALAELDAKLPQLSTGLDLEAVRRSAVAAGFAGAAAASDEERTLDALRIGASTGGAEWSLARAGGTVLALLVAGRLVQITGDATPRSPRRWLQDFWLALLVDDSHALSAICYAPAQLRGTEPAAPYVDQLAEAVRRYWLHDSAAPSALLAALRASDPDRLSPAEADRALDLDVPLIEVLFALFERDAAKLDQALARAFTQHDMYWSGERADDPEGWLALPLAAVIAQAQRVGLSVSASSPRAPAALLRASGAREVLLCPYCLSPLVDGMRLCPACLEDTTHDAWIETDLAAFHASPRSRCSSCSTTIARLAVRCPSCRNPQR